LELRSEQLWKKPNLILDILDKANVKLPVRTKSCEMRLPPQLYEYSGGLLLSLTTENRNSVLAKCRSWSMDVTWQPGALIAKKQPS